MNHNSSTIGSKIGGFVGQNNYIIEKSYARGSVGGNNTLGGFVGENQSSATIANCYFDTGTAGHNDNKATGITTSDIGNGGTKPFITGSGGWDFTSVWKATGDSNWPDLLWHWQTTEQP